MTESIRNSLLLLAIICPFYVAIIGSCCSDQCQDTNPCTSECYSKPSTGCPSPSVSPYNVADGTECLSGSIWGQCSTGVCGDNECKSTGNPDLHNLKACDYPRNGGTEGICIDERCVTAGDDDSCVKLNFGRINCCDTTGCGMADGILCPSANWVQDNTACDPSGVLPVGQGSGVCIQGYCTIGSCDGSCANTQCKSKSCDPSDGSCSTAQATGTALPCTLAGGAVGSGICIGGDCKPAAPCAVDCDDGNPCTADSCSLAKLVNDTCPNKVCCVHEPESASTTCTVDSSAGVCDGSGNCVKVVCN